MSYNSADCARRNNKDALIERFHLSQEGSTYSLLAVPGRPLLSGAVSCFLLCFLVFVSCAVHETPKTRDSLMKEYSMFTDSLNALPSVSVPSLSSVVIRWYELENEIFEIISRDTLHENENLLAIYQMSSFGEQVNTRICESIDMSHVSFLDLLAFQQSVATACYSETDIDLTEAICFYDAQDRNSYNPEQKPLAGYLSLLDGSLSSDFSQWEHVLHFLSEEDQYYRAFLQVISDQDQERKKDVVRKTEEVCSKIAASYMNDSLRKEQLFGYMVMRTNRRLLFAADSAIEAVLSEQCTSVDEAASAVSSILSPFIYFNSSLLSLRTQAQNKELGRIGKQMSEVFQHLHAQGFQIVSHPDSLPNRIMKDYVAFVMNN